ncbi:TetR family transcriptional regulator [Tamaricihabitans halophyticus]|uniref:TetR family transcriptional regulator n=1 Tax=Tamaricihabitans halophyticus TaxID=1262583 RepID=A0A4R2QFJ7_9PSEU|nr:TetR/AcrR family transcriptional regulator [Tamaricihabitans halophyticus]TCP47910.1 TetR family transcriptional regulator [Tamaricihabitans halophyticus]
MTAATTPRWRRMEPDERKQQIFTCAIRLFSEHPYVDVSTTDIARAAGVARGLINHYFGTKRELYLEVIRVMVTIPHSAMTQIPDGSLDERIDASVNWFLDTVSRHGKMWISAIGAEGFGQDQDVERILAEADDIAAERVLEAVGLTEAPRHRSEIRAMIRAYGGMTKTAMREWLSHGILRRSDVHLLLTGTLRALVRDVFPALRASDQASEHNQANKHGQRGPTG